MSKRTALIAAAGALGGAVIVGLVILAITQIGGDDGETADPKVRQVELATETAKLSRDVGEIAESIADGEGVEKRIRDARADATDLIAEVAGFDREAPARGSLKRAGEANLDAATELESVESEMSEGRQAVEEEQEASEEASSQLASLSDGVEALGGEVDRANKRAMAGTTELAQAIAAIAAELEGENDLSDQAKGQLDTAERNVRAIERDLAEAFESLQAAAASLSDELAARSEELEPDVVLDCPELSATMGAGIYEVSVRNMSCTEAGALLGEFGPPAGFACTELESGYEYTVYRCTSGNRAIRYEVGA